jgi:hemerythrin
MFQFTEDCKTGIPQIDNEHEYLFSIMNEISETLQKDLDVEDERKLLEQLLIQLRDYGATHFAHEEAYMEEHKDAELESQKRAHAAFIDKVDDLNMKLRRMSPGENHDALADMARFLTKWLYQHILSSDTMIGHVTHLADNKGTKEDFCPFTEEYWTGIPQVDEEHRKLFELIGRAYEMVEYTDVSESYDDIMRLMDELEDYTDYHFKHEEEFMESVGYKGLEAQRRAHESFLVRLEDKDEAEQSENRVKFLEDLLDFLYAWLGRHILKMDKLIPAKKKEYYYGG